MFLYSILWESIDCSSVLICAHTYCTLSNVKYVIKYGFFSFNFVLKYLSVFNAKMQSAINDMHLNTFLANAWTNRFEFIFHLFDAIDLNDALHNVNVSKIRELFSFLQGKCTNLRRRNLNISILTKKKIRIFIGKVSLKL